VAVALRRNDQVYTHSVTIYKPRLNAGLNSLRYPNR